MARIRPTLEKPAKPVITPSDANRLQYDEIIYDKISAFIDGERDFLIEGLFEHLTELITNRLEIHEDDEIADALANPEELEQLIDDELNQLIVSIDAV